MKNFKILFVAIGLSLLVNLTIQAQLNVIKLNVLSPIVRTLNVQYEHKLNANSSFQLGLFYTGYSNDDSDLTTTWRGFGITPEYRFYLSDTEAPQGVYLAPFLRYQNFKVEVDDEVNNQTDKGTFTAFGGGLVIGKQWLFKEKVALDLFFGPQYASGNLDVDNDSVDGDVFDGFGLRLGVSLGFAF